MRVTFGEWRGLSRGRDAGSGDQRPPPKEDIMKRFIAAALAASCFVSSAPVFATDGGPGVFDKWLNPDAPECVPVSAFKSVSTVTDLTQEQFQFARALYIAIPP